MRAGLVGGARVVAVATGLFGVDELVAAGADVVLADLVDVDGVVAALDRVRELGPTGPRSGRRGVGFVGLAPDEVEAAGVGIE